MPSYLEDILGQQQQSQITGRGKLKPGQVEAAFQGYIGAEEEAAQRGESLALQGRQVATGEKSEAATERYQGQQAALANDALQSQKQTGTMQSIVSGVSAAGTLGLGYSAASKAGLFGSTTPATTGGATTGGTATAGGAAVAGETATYTAATDAAAELSATQAAYTAGTATAAELSAAEGASAAAYAADAAASTTVMESIGTGILYVFEAVAAVVAWVLCSELVRQGKLDQSIVDDEWSYIREIITDDEYNGYRIIADPLVKLMQKSKIFTSFMCPLIRGFAYEMASRVNPEIQGSHLGKFILWFGRPLCRFTARIKRRNERWLIQRTQ